MPRNKRFLRSKNTHFAENFFPAQPLALWKRARTAAQSQIDAARKVGPSTAQNIAYINWLKRESMLAYANKSARKLSGTGSMWQNPYAKPQPRRAVRQASVWYTAYPISLVTKQDDSILKTLGDKHLWGTFEQIGIKGIHTGPMKKAGGLNGWQATPSIDGSFDRISTTIDSLFGSEAEYRRLSQTAAEHGAIVIDDIVPGHTGKGADFRLAEMNYADYPGIYHMVEIHQTDWKLLPDVPKGRDSANLTAEQEEALKKKGYIIGKLQRVIFYEPGVKETNWSATNIVKGVDGEARRWVYLHYFKEGQPSLNWLDPSFAGMKLVIGDAIHSLNELGSKAVRLDANGFLGIERVSDDEPAWSEGHPLSEVANQLISSMVRKLGGFTFQELNLSVDDIKMMSDGGADLSYDFINRPAYHHALATGDTEFLRLTLRTALKTGIDPASLIHALQNHDELTYELVHFWTVHKDDLYTFRNQEVTGLQLRDTIRQELDDKLTGSHAPYNLPFTTNGIACTTASVIAASLGYDDLDDLTETKVEKIKNVHLLLAMFNAWQPGVFALSGWDLSGSLPLDKKEVSDLIKDGDTRWVNRGSYDLLGVNPGATKSSSGMPVTRNLYGTLKKQMAQENSFAWLLHDILEIREKYGIATSHQVDIPDVSHKCLLVMVHQLEDDRMQVTVLNFSDEEISGVVASEHLPAGARVSNMRSEEEIATIDDLHSCTVAVLAFGGLSLLITPTTET